ncbi:MAG: hypothetical protein Q9161_008346 [Pseudevernia consocians]
MESKQEQIVAATLHSRPAGHLCEPNDGPTSPDNTNDTGALFKSEHNMSSHGPRAKLPEVLAVASKSQTIRQPSKSEHEPSKPIASSQLQCPKGTAKAPLSPTYKPVGHQLTFGSRDDASLAAASCRKFQEQMMRLSAEICQMIMDMVFEEAFGPRRVHPHRDPPITNIFLALDKELYRKLREQYWTKNTWNISKGPLNETMRFMTEKPYNESTTEFSLQIPNKAALQIRSIELSFSNADTPHLLEWHQLAEQQSAAAPPYRTLRHLGPILPQPPNPVRIAQRNECRVQRAQRYDDIQQQLIHTWQDKFDRIAMLNLRHLTLDFTEAYNPGGLYLGVNLVRRLIPFAHGMPYDFKIVAPDSWIERQIREAFSVLNAG